ncbi:hypothetical protein [Pseudomonas sp. R5(2019)]|uniref:hypothetical protein n=1 Tax=Pseudomonas sp. R5(2019) TaxID=2697566 RepID=UPI0014132819|nr:hypothetical protein [Pseudomonas sp. R5(2019)]NBA96607.1 hypothetical protein [Pseudomonas sp. R5(2019)]
MAIVIVFSLITLMRRKRSKGGLDVSTRNRHRAAESTPRLVTSVAARDFWVDFLQQHVAEFAAMNQPFYDQIEVVEATHDQEYLQQMNSIGRARKWRRLLWFSD